MQVETPNGLTVEQNLEENVLQGDTLSSIIASNQVDIIGKDLLIKNPDFLFKYKNDTFFDSFDKNNIIYYIT